MSTEENTGGTTTTTTVSVEDINDMLGIPGADSVMTSESGKTEPKPNLFSSKPVDLSFLDKEEEDEDEDPAAKKPDAVKSAAEIKAELDAISNPKTEEEEEESEAGKTGRPKTDKNAMVEFAKKWIADKKLIPFDDEKPIDKYTIQDFEELMEANLEAREDKLRKEIPAAFYNELPQEMQIAHKYIADGGNDLKSLFRALAHVEEIRDLSPTDEKDQEQIVRSYLAATDWSQEDIDEEVTSWKDRDELEAKATKFKPKLDALQQEVVVRKMHEQESMRKQQQQQANVYMDNVYKALSPGELNGIKLDKKIQGVLYAGLVQPEYPSISGKRTNLLGHLLEKYQWVEPRHDLIAEALWLLSDPDGYRSKVKEGGKKEATEKTIRMLKTEESTRLASSQGQEEEDAKTRTGTGPTLKRPTPGFFKR